MRKLNKLWMHLLIVFGFVVSNAIASSLVEVRQYYNPAFKTFVLSANSAEQAALEAGQISGWETIPRFSFFAWSAPGPGLVAVCRAFYAVAGKESHFHSANPAECEKMKTLPGWVYEGDAMFYVNPPVASQCTAGNPIYRVWNQVSNHAYVPSTTAAEVLRERWNGFPEGVVMCVANYGMPFTWNDGGGTIPPPPPPPPVASSAGKVDLWLEASGAVHAITPTLVEGKIIAVGADGQGFKLDPAAVTTACWRGDTFGWTGNTKACAPFTAGQAKITGLCNKDRGMHVLRDAEGKDYFLDYSSSTRWEVKGLSPIVGGGFLEYAEVGTFQKPKVSVKNNKLTLEFNRDCETGFGLNGLPTDFTASDVFQFQFVSTTGPNTVAFESWDADNKAFQVIFNGLKCSDTGSVMVLLPATRNQDGTVATWQTNPVGWFSIGTPPNSPDLIWSFGTGVTPVVDTTRGIFGFKYQLSGC